MSRRRLGQPAINLLPADLLPDAAHAGRHQDDRRPHRAPADRQGQWRHATGTVDWIEHLGDQNHLHLEVATAGW